MRLTILLLGIFSVSSSFGLAQNSMTIEKPEPQAGAMFGWDATLTMYDNFFISAPKYSANGSDSVGAVYVYYSDWQEITTQLNIDTLLFADSTQISQFGFAVESYSEYDYKEHRSIQTLFVSALTGPDSLQNAGVIYRYQKTENEWEPIQVVTGSDTKAGDMFGYSVAQNPYEPILLVGAYAADGDSVSSGAVYIFEKDSTGLIQKQKLIAEDGKTGDRFGYSVVTDYDGVILVGAPNAEGMEENSGAVYVFRRENEEWTQTSKLIDSLGTDGDEFGYHVARQTEYAVPTKKNPDTPEYYPLYIGAPGKKHDNKTGSVFLVGSYDGFSDFSVDYEITSDTTGHEGFGKYIAYSFGNLLIPETSIENGAGIVHSYRFFSSVDTVYHSYYPDRNTNFSSTPKVFTGDYIPLEIIGLPYSSRNEDEFSGDVYSYYTMLSSIEENSESPVGYKLDQNFPNPFNPSTTIKYQLPVSSLVQLKVYDLVGREVAELVNEVQSSGNHQVTFNAHSLASGVYLYRLTAGTQIFTKKMMLIK